MAHSKIVLAPLGYGEMAPRDIEAVSFGSILIKPDMSYIDSNPMWYEDGKTYISCKHDYSDLEEKIDYVLDNFNELQQTMIPYARQKFDELYTPENTAINVYNIFKELHGVTTE
jgi:glycosyltransferase involved in cell wall biosynthesis